MWLFHFVSYDYCSQAGQKWGYLFLVRAKLVSVRRRFSIICNFLNVTQHAFFENSLGTFTWTSESLRFVEMRDILFPQYIRSRISWCGECMKKGGIKKCCWSKVYGWSGSLFSSLFFLFLLLSFLLSFCLFSSFSKVCLCQDGKEKCKIIFRGNIPSTHQIYALILHTRPEAGRIITNRKWDIAIFT